MVYIIMGIQALDLAIILIMRGGPWLSFSIDFKDRDNEDRLKIRLT